MKYIFTIILCWCSLLNAGTIDPKNNDNDYISLGSKYDCVAQLVTINKSKVSAKSSCVLVSKTHFLTAAHIFNEPTTQVYIFVAGQKLLVDKIFVHPRFKINNVGENDIAVGKLKNPITFNIDYPKIYSKNDEQNKIAEIVGYGLTGNFNTGAKISDSKKRAGTNRISHIFKDLLVCDAKKTSRSRYEILISHGDSGGGLFINGQLAGINSLVMATDGKADSSWSDESGHTRLSKFQEWIQQILSNK